MDTDSQTTKIINLKLAITNFKSEMSYLIRCDLNEAHIFFLNNISTFIDLYSLIGKEIQQFMYQKYSVNKIYLEMFTMLKCTSLKLKSMATSHTAIFDDVKNLIKYGQLRTLEYILELYTKNNNSKFSDLVKAKQHFPNEFTNLMKDDYMDHIKYFVDQIDKICTVKDLFGKEISTLITVNIFQSDIETLKIIVDNHILFKQIMENQHQRAYCGTWIVHNNLSVNNWISDTITKKDVKSLKFIIDYLDK